MLDIIYIYGLVCPIKNTVRYIGKTKNINERYRKHLSAKKNTATSKWVFALKERGLKPKIEIIFETNETEWQYHEKRIIKEFIDGGFHLFNHTIGGEGGNTMGGRKLTKEQSNKISLSKIGKKRPDLIGNKLQAKRVAKYDLEGNKIAEYSSIKEAAKSINRSDRRIQFMVKVRLLKFGFRC